MGAWLRLILGAVAMGLIWAAAWAAAGAAIASMGLKDSLMELWIGPPIGLHPGFVGGVVFFAALAIASRPHSLHELSVSAVVACGALVGLLLGILPFAINEPPAGSPLGLVAAIVIGSMTLTGALSAAGSLALVKGIRATTR